MRDHFLLFKHKKKHKKEKKKKSKDNTLPSIDDIIAQRLQQKCQNTDDKDVKDEEEKKSRAPMTKAEYDQRQSVVRRVYDEDTGRTRLVKGKFSKIIL